MADADEMQRRAVRQRLASALGSFQTFAADGSEFPDPDDLSYVSDRPSERSMPPQAPAPNQSRPGPFNLPAPSPRYDPNDPSHRMPLDLMEKDNKAFEQEAWEDLLARSKERGVTPPRDGTTEEWERFFQEFWKAEASGSDSDGQLLDFFSKYSGARTPWHRDFNVPPKDLLLDQELGPSGRPRPRPKEHRNRLFCPDITSDLDVDNQLRSIYRRNMSPTA